MILVSYLQQMEELILPNSLQLTPIEPASICLLNSSLVEIHSFTSLGRKSIWVSGSQLYSIFSCVFNRLLSASDLLTAVDPDYADDQRVAHTPQRQPAQKLWNPCSVALFSIQAGRTIDSSLPALGAAQLKQLLLHAALIFSSPRCSGLS